MDDTSFLFKEQEYYPNGQIDILRLFFEDVSNIPIIRGKQDYLPLTRRIRRGELLSSLHSQSITETFDMICARLSREVQSFHGCCQELGRPQLDVVGLGSQVEDFLDNSANSIPPALAHSLGKRRRLSDPAPEQFEECGWHVFYLLSLIPPQLRQAYPGFYYSSIVGTHFDLVQTEAAASLTRLIEGTLRYVINIAVQYADRGVSYLDLVQEGVEGLRIAATKYIERKGHFQQYAGAWIRQRISRHIAESRSLIRVPVHMAEKVNQLLEQIEAGSGAMEDDAELLEAIAADDDGRVPLSASQLRRLLTATARHFSLERTRLNGQTEDSEPLYFEDVLATEEDVEAIIEKDSDTEFLRCFLQQHGRPTSERNWELIQLRLGLADGEERTLEEVGQVYGLSRERVRQIEATMMQRLQGKTLIGGSVLNVFVDRPRRMGFALSPRPFLDDFHPVYEATFAQSEKDDVQRLIHQYIQRGRRTEWNIRGLHGRRALLYQVLSELGRPTHYSIIHQHVLERVPEGLHFTKKDTYATLFYATHIFRPYGQAVFGLSAWDEADTLAGGGELIFSYCPTPLLPLQAHASSFFDSVEYGRRLLGEQRLTAAEFWQAMLAWAGVEPATANAQEAFNAWYAVELLPPVRYATVDRTKLELTTPTDADLSRMRVHCLDALCRRVAKMPELLLTLTTIGRATIYNIQRTLFGSAAAGFDVPMRLRLLAAFGAVRPLGDEWRMTEIGRATLATFPGAELPEADQAEEEADSDLDFLDLDEFSLELFEL